MKLPPPLLLPPPLISFLGLDLGSEILYEDEAFPERSLAALVVAKVYFHLGEYDDSMAFALNAGGAFDVNGSSQFVAAIVAQCIDKYTALRQAAPDAAVADARLEAVVNRMFARCFAAREHAQAAGIALETHRLDVLEQAIATAADVPGMLAYVLDIAQTLLAQRAFRGAVLRLLARLYAALPTPAFGQMSQIYVFLDDAAAAARLLQQLLARGDGALALQLACDLADTATQHFLTRVRALLAAAAAEDAAAAAAAGLDAGTLARLDDVLSGAAAQRLTVDFLARSSNTDLLILQTTRKALPPSNSVLHSALVLSNAAMYAGTTSDAFLRDDPKWVMQAQNWAKFGIVSSLGVIHKGHVAEAMNVAAPYLPKDGGSGGNPFEVGGGLFALGLMAAGHGGAVTDYLLQQLDAPAAAEPVQHGNCLGLGLAALGSGDAAHFDRLTGVLFTDNAVAGEAAGLAMGHVMLGSADAAAVTVMVQYAQVRRPGEPAAVVVVGGKGCCLARAFGSARLRLGHPAAMARMGVCARRRRTTRRLSAGSPSASRSSCTTRRKGPTPSSPSSPRTRCACPPVLVLPSLPGPADAAAAVLFVGAQDALLRMAAVHTVAMAYVGQAPYSRDAKAYEPARKMLMAARPYVTRLSSSGYIEEMDNGQLCVVIG